MRSYLTVVIPTYNCEQFLKRCLDSIINQSYKNLNIIIVDDASTDHTWEIIEEYSKKHINIQATQNEQNQGVCYGRNFGINNSDSEYVTFIDDDDYIDILTYEKCMSAIDSQSDIIIYGLSHDYMKTNLIERKYIYDRQFSISGEYALRIYGHTIHDEFEISPVVNNKIYRTSFLKDNELLFNQSVRYQEDDIFTFETLLCAEKILFIPNCLYHYCQNPNSAIHQVSNVSITHFVRSYKSLQDYLKNKSLFEKYKDEFYLKFKSSLKGVIRRTVNYSKDADQAKQLLSKLGDLIFNQFDVAEILGYCNLHNI